MAKPEWGTKRMCQSCGARFYDLAHDPIVCPKCGEVHDPLANVKQSRSRAAPEPKAAKSKAAPVPEDVADDDVESDDDDAPETDDDDDLIEDASELGEDDEVIDAIDDDDDDKSV